MMIDLAVFGSSEARLIHAIITNIKHTIKTRAIIIFVNAPIIVGKAWVAFVFPSQTLIQSQIIGKHVFNLIQSSQLHQQSAAWTEFHSNHQEPNNTANIHPNKYNNSFFINFGIKK